MQPCRLVTAQTAVTLQCPGDRLAMEITEMECGVIREKRETLMCKEINLTDFWSSERVKIMF